MSRSGNKVLYVATSKPDETREIEAVLRNEGYAVRARTVATPEELQEQISVLPPDVVVCSEAVTARPMSEFAEVCSSCTPPVPVVVLSRNLALDNTLSAMDSGARDLICTAEPRHLALVLAREIDAHINAVRALNSQRRLTELEAQHSLLLRESGASVATVQEGVILRANPSWARTFGYDDEASMEGLPLMDSIAEGDRDRLRKSMQEWATLEDSTLIELTGLKLDGSSTPLAIEVTPGTLDDEPCFEIQARVNEAALSGASPTGASDRIALHGALEEAAEHPPEHGHRAVILVTIDGYASLEDEIGFRDAELVVQQLRKLVNEHLHGEAPIFRYSLSKIVALPTSGETTTFRDSSDALVKKVANTKFKTDLHELELTVTVVAYPLLGSERPQKLLREVQAEADKAAESGGNKMVFAGPGAVSAETREHEQNMLDNIRAALREDRFKLVYQPIASLEGGAPSFYDTWIRMIDRDGTELKARDFLPIAERNDLMPLIDHWVVQRAMGMVRQHAQEGKADNVTIFVRLSDETLHNTEAFLKWFGAQISKRPLARMSLVFEVEEQSLLERGKVGLDLANKLHKLEQGIAVVHFGCAKSSLELLDAMPLDFVKIDPGFTNSLTGADSKADEVAKIMEAAKARNIGTIAEHIDDANAMARLWQLGVNYLQGNHVQEAEVVLTAADVNIV